MTDSSTQVAIETVGLTKRFGRETAVRDLTMRIPAGSTFGFIGPNGAGKSTTIKMLMGVLRRSAGEARVLGIDPAVDHLSVKQRVGYVPEHQFIFRWMRAGEAVSFCRSLYPKWNDKLCNELTRLFGVDLNKKVKQMSKGTVVKLSLLLAMSHEPDVLILDEPMAGLDPMVREEFLDGILQTATEHERTVLFSSHTLSDVQRMADAVGIINEGRLLVHCEVDALLNSTKRIRAVLSDGCQPERPPENMIWQRVNRREWLLSVKDFSTETVEQLRADNRLEQVEVMDMGLEDIFKDFVRGWRTSA